jgi:plastocyanin
MFHRLAITALALGFLLAASASAQHHHAAPNLKGYDSGPGGGDPNPPGECAGVQAKVTVSDLTFQPATVTIDAGQPVCWTWSGTSVPHTVHADDGSFTTGSPATQNTFQHTFTTPGTFGYYCQVHGSLTGGMRGTVVVLDPSGGGGGGGGTPQGPGTIGLNPATYTVSESAGALTVTVERANGDTGAASVKYVTVPGTAKAGKDFIARTGILRWANGDGNPKTFAVAIKNDTIPEPDKVFSIKLSNATGAKLGTNLATVTIHDDDGCNASAASLTRVVAAGQSAGEIRVTWAASEPATAGSLRIERRQSGGVFQEVGSAAAGATSFTDSGLPGGTTFQYRIRAVAADGSSAVSGIAAGATDGPATPCDETRPALCLAGGRFEATVEWNPSAAGAGRESKRAMLPDSPNTGLFALSPEDEPQLVLSVLDRCAVNGRYWIYFAAVGDVESMVKVRDTQTGRTRVYFNPGGRAPAPVHDVDAFAACP